MLKRILASLTLASSISLSPFAQVGTIGPDYTFEFGPFPNQRIHVFAPDVEEDRSPSGRLSVIVHDHGGGFSNRAPLINLGVTNAAGDQLNEYRRTLNTLREDGAWIFTVGATGSAGASPPGNLGLGLWEPIDPNDTDPFQVHYYEEAMHASRAIDEFCYDTLGETLPPLKAWVGISAGSMRGLQITTFNVHAVVAANTPLSYPALLQSQPHVQFPNLKFQGQFGVPYTVLSDALKFDQVGASCWSHAIAFEGPICWLTNFGQQVIPGAPNPANCDPVKGIENVLLDIHDANQAASCFLARRNPKDVYFCEESDAVGFPGEQTYFDDGENELPGGPQVGVRSRECQVNAIAFLRKEIIHFQD